MSASSDLSRQARKAAVRLVEANQAELRKAVPEDDAGRAYREEFEAAAYRADGPALTRAQLTAALAEAEVLVAGTFHTCPEVARGLARVVEDLAAAGSPPSDLVLPFLAEGEVEGDPPAPGEAEDWLQELDGEHPWSFERVAYAELVEAALACGARLHPRGAAPPEGAGPAGRARAEAARVAGLRAQGATRVLAVVGEQHAVPAHMGAHLDEPATFLVPGSWPWLLPRLGGPGPLDACQLGEGLFGFHPASPTRLFESFSNWLHQVPEIPWPCLPAWRAEGDPSLDHMLARLGEALADAVGLPVPDEDAPPWGPVLCHDDPAELATLDLDPATTRELLGQVSMGRGYFLPGVPAVFLAGAAGGAVAEEVGHAMHFAARPVVPTTDPALDFPRRAIREAVGFALSRVVVPDRPFWDPSGEVEEVPEGLRTLLEGADPMLRAKRFLLEHQGEDPVLFDPPPEALQALWDESPEAYLAAAHAAGYLLGVLCCDEAEVLEALFQLDPAAPEAWKHAWALAALFE